MSTQTAIQELQNTIKALELIQEVHDLTKVRYLGSWRDISEMEKDLLIYTAEGLTAKEIAGKVHRSVRTVEIQRNALMHKLGAKSIAHMVALGFKRKIIQ